MKLRAAKLNRFHSNLCPSSCAASRAQRFIDEVGEAAKVDGPLNFKSSTYTVILSPTGKAPGTSSSRDSGSSSSGGYSQQLGADLPLPPPPPPPSSSASPQTPQQQQQPLAPPPPPQASSPPSPPSLPQRPPLPPQPTQVCGTSAWTCDRVEHVGENWLKLPLSRSCGEGVWL